MRASDWAALFLATWRLTRFVNEDEGPASFMLRLRILAGAYDFNEQGVADTVLGRGITCPFCVGMYAALLWMVLRRFRWGRWVCDVWAVAGAGALISLWAKGVENGSNQR